MKNTIKILSVICLILIITLSSCNNGGGGGGNLSKDDSKAEPAEASAIYLSKDSEGNRYTLSFPTAAARAVVPTNGSVFELIFNTTPSKGGTVTNVLGSTFTLKFSDSNTTLSVTISNGFLKTIQGTIIGKDGNTLKEITEKKDLTPAGNPNITSVSGTFKFDDSMAPATVTVNNPNFTMTILMFGNANLAITVRGTYTVSEGIITATIQTVQAPSELPSVLSETNFRMIEPYLFS